MDEKNTAPEKISWEIKRIEEKHRSVWFYIVLLAIMTGLLLIALLQKNFLFGVFVIIAAGMVLFLSHQPPQTYSFSLTQDGLVIGDNESEYTYDQFKHFDIYEFSHDDYELFFVFKERLRPILRIRIWKGDKEKIDNFLSQKLKRKQTNPSLLDILSKIVGI